MRTFLSDFEVLLELTGVLSAVRALLAIFVAGMLWGSTWGLPETQTSERLVLYGTYGHIHRHRGHIHTCSLGRL